MNLSLIIEEKQACLQRLIFKDVSFPYRELQTLQKEVGE